MQYWVNALLLFPSRCCSIGSNYKMPITRFEYWREGRLGCNSISVQILKKRSLNLVDVYAFKARNNFSAKNERLSTAHRKRMTNMSLKFAQLYMYILRADVWIFRLIGWSICFTKKQSQKVAIYCNCAPASYNAACVFRGCCCTPFIFRSCCWSVSIHQQGTSRFFLPKTLRGVVRVTSSRYSATDVQGCHQRVVQ